MTKPKTSENRYEVVADVIHCRRTLKVLGDCDAPRMNDSAHQNKHNAVVIRAIEDSGMAPFHYNRNLDGIAEPWRYHVLWSGSCRKIASKFFDWFDDVKPNNKIPMMLSACGALVLVNWLPQEGGSELSAEKLRDVNEEHLAAASAATQNLLLLLTAAGMGTYWSSGGQFRTPEMFERIGVDKSERLIAAVFVEYPCEDPEAGVKERLPGKMRSLRSPAEKWTRVVDVE